MVNKAQRQGIAEAAALKMAVREKLLKRAYGPSGISIFEIVQDGQTSLENWL